MKLFKIKNTSDKIPVMKLDSAGVTDLREKLVSKQDELAKVQSKIRENLLHSEHDWHASNTHEDEIAMIKYEIERLKRILDNAVVVNELNNEDELIVNIGDVLELFLDYGDEDKESMVLRLGTTHQKENEDGIEMISVESALGKAIYKKEVGTTVKFGDENIFSATILRKINEDVKDETIDKPKQFSKK